MGDHNETQARAREREAWDARYKHGKAARIWAAVAEEKPEMRAEAEILSAWMCAYETADAEAEQEFRYLAARLTAADDGGEEKNG